MLKTKGVRKQINRGLILMYKFVNKMQAYSLFLTLMICAMQTYVYALADTQETLTTKVLQTLADTCDDVGDFDLFTPDELAHEQAVIEEQEAKLGFYAIVVSKLQQIGGKLSSPFFYLLYKFYKWKAQRA
jgi:hypothetical protein